MRRPYNNSRKILYIYYTAALSLKSIALLRHGQNPRAHSFEEGQIHAQNSECLTSACRKHDWIDCETEHSSGTVDVSCQLPKHRCDLCGSPNASDLLLFGSSQCQAGPVNRRPWSDGFDIGGVGGMTPDLQTHHCERIKHLKISEALWTQNTVPERLGLKTAVIYWLYWLLTSATVLRLAKHIHTNAWGNCWSIILYLDFLRVHFIFLFYWGYISSKEQTVPLWSTCNSRSFINSLSLVVYVDFLWTLWFNIHATSYIYKPPRTHSCTLCRSRNSGHHWRWRSSAALRSTWWLNRLQRHHGRWSCLRGHGSHRWSRCQRLNLGASGMLGAMCPIQHSKFGDIWHNYVMRRRQFRFNHCWLIYHDIWWYIMIYHDISSFDASSHFGAHGKIALPIWNITWRVQPFIANIPIVIPLCSDFVI